MYEYNKLVIIETFCQVFLRVLIAYCSSVLKNLREDSPETSEAIRKIRIISFIYNLSNISAHFPANWSWKRRPNGL
jgi:hypothetical protein